MKCRIQWFDDRSNLTPDDNEAIGEVWIIEHPVIRDDLSVYMSPASEHMPICAVHAKRLPDINRKWPVWTFKAYSDDCTEV